MPDVDEPAAGRGCSRRDITLVVRLLAGAGANRGLFQARLAAGAAFKGPANRLCASIYTSIYRRRETPTPNPSGRETMLIHNLITARGDNRWLKFFRPALLLLDLTFT